MGNGTASGTSGTSGTSGPQTTAKIEPKPSRPTRYVILYRIEGDDEHSFRTLLSPPNGDGRMERLTIEGHGQPDARSAFLELCRDDKRPITVPTADEVVQVAAVPVSSWDPKSPRRKITTSWD